MNFKLTEQQERQFEQVVEEKQFLIRLALRNAHISKTNYGDFYSYALEGLLVSFLIAEENEELKEEFDKFALRVMKRKIIDEIRSRNRQKDYGFFSENNSLLVSDKGYELTKIDLLNSLKKVLTDEEKEFFDDFLKTGDIKETAKNLNLSIATSYRLLERIKNKCKNLLMD